jgi:ATP-dependent RNA helicase DDX19/DBP5
MVEKSEAGDIPAKKDFSDDRGEGVELMKLKNVKQKASPFINQQRSWDDDEHFTIPADLQKGIVEELGFNKPSNI